MGKINLRTTVTLRPFTNDHHGKRPFRFGGTGRFHMAFV